MIEREILITHKKVNKRTYLAGQKHATFLFKFKFAKRATCKFFSALFLLLVGSGPKKVNANRKIGQFFVGFFHILKRTKSVLQLNRTETLQLVLKNADVILYTHARAYIKILFITAQ